MAMVIEILCYGYLLLLSSKELAWMGRTSYFESKVGKEEDRAVEDDIFASALS